MTSPEPKQRTLAETERDEILKALEATGGNVMAAARRLGIRAVTIYRKLKRYEQEAG